MKCTRCQETVEFPMVYGTCMDCIRWLIMQDAAHRREEASESQPDAKQKAPSALERRQHEAIVAMTEIKHRIEGCNDEKCRVCRENRTVLRLMEDAVAMYARTRRAG